jgi:hypothetical protein
MTRKQERIGGFRWKLRLQPALGNTLITIKRSYQQQHRGRLRAFPINSKRVAHIAPGHPRNHRSCLYCSVLNHTVYIVVHWNTPKAWVLPGLLSGGPWGVHHRTRTVSWWSGTENKLTHRVNTSCKAHACNHGGTRNVVPYSEPPRGPSVSWTAGVMDDGWDSEKKKSSWDDILVSRHSRGSQNSKNAGQYIPLLILYCW